MWKPPEQFFEPKPLVIEPAYRSDPEKKRLFGLELAKGLAAFEAAINVFSDTNQALWASQNWLNDPIVLEVSKTVVEKSIKNLDKDQFLDTVMSIAHEKDQSGKFYLNEAKDRIAALTLYAKVAGFIDKVEIDNSTKFITNTMKIKLVSPANDKKETEVIEAVKVLETSPNVLPMKVRLVS